MPIATPEKYAEMLDTAKAGAYAFPAINVSSSQTLNAALAGFAEAGSDGIIQVSTGGADYLSGPTVKNMVSGSLAFAARFGFMETDRQIEQTRAVGEEPAPGPPPAGIEVLTLDQQPELWASCYETFGRQVLAVVNFPPRQIGSFQSEVLVLGVPDEAGEVVLLRPDLRVPDGGRMF